MDVENAVHFNQIGERVCSVAGFVLAPETGDNRPP